MTSLCLGVGRENRNNTPSIRVDGTFTGIIAMKSQGRVNITSGGNKPCAVSEIFPQLGDRRLHEKGGF